jgi:hypothetical protein
MNPYAEESAPQYQFRRCSEALDQARRERRIVQSIYIEAKRTHAEDSRAIIEAWLPRSRARINQLSAQGTRLRRKLEAAKVLEVAH